MSKVSLLFLYSLLMALGQFLFKRSAQQLDISTSSKYSIKDYIDVFCQPSFVIACFIYALATILWVALLAQLELSVAYPVAICFSILLTLLAGTFFFSESFTLARAIGVALLVSAVVVLSKS